MRPVLPAEDPFVDFVGKIPLFVEQRQVDGSVILKTAKGKLRFNDQQFPKEKSGNSYRIFCMGESTTFGHPYNDKVSFCGWLRVFLKAADPTRNWEVINAGGISYASYRIANLMDELKQYQPDLFIVYCGQNEFLEQRSYGRLIDLPDWALHLSGALSGTRTYAAMKKTIDTLRPDPLQNAQERYKLSGEVDEILEHTVGPTSYHRDDTLQRRIIKHYRLSMRRMVNIAQGAGAKIILVQPAINLKDFSPFKSEHKKGLSGEALRNWTDLYQRATKLHEAKRCREALVMYRQALDIDDRYAELHYRIGQVLYEMGNFDPAEEAFWRAVDEDIAPLRILSSMQRVVEEVALGRDVSLVDFPRVLKEAYLRRYDHAILGKEYFVDHVHTSIEGYRLLGLALVNQLIKQNIVKPVDTWNDGTREDLTRRIVASLDFNVHAQALRTLGQTLDWAGKLGEAYNIFLKAMELQGPHPMTYRLLARVLSRQGKYDEAIQYLHKALVHYPDLAGTRQKLGELLERQGKSVEAAHYFQGELELMVRAQPYEPEAHHRLAVILRKQGNLEQAIHHFSEAIRLNPDDAIFKNDLQQALVERDRNSARH